MNWAASLQFNKGKKKYTQLSLDGVEFLKSWILRIVQIPSLYISLKKRHFCWSCAPEPTEAKIHGFIVTAKGQAC